MTSGAYDWDFIHAFNGYGTCESSCRIRVFASSETERANYPDIAGDIKSIEIPRRIVVLITETGDGTSITNAIETIASQVLPRVVPHSALRGRVRFIEHYPAEQRGELGETFHFVTFVAYDAHGASFARNEWGLCYSGPRWSRATRDQVLELVGREVEL